MPSATELAVTTDWKVETILEFWLGPLRGDLDESVMIPSWLPAQANGWTDVTSTVLLGRELQINHDGKGQVFTVTVADESRATWRDDIAVAVVSSHTISTGLRAGRATVAFGYADGSGRQQFGLDLAQTGERLVTYAGYWDRLNAPALVIGQRNIMKGASLREPMASLPVPDAEAPLEYIDQDNCDGEKLIDETLDTCAVIDAIAGVIPPVIGQTNGSDPKFLRLFGPFTPGVASGGQPRFFELWCGHNIIPWGSFDNPSAVPNLFESNSNVRNDSTVTTTIIPGANPSRYQIEAKANPAHPNELRGIQWNIGVSGEVPLHIEFDYKAAEGTSVGKHMFVTHNSGAMLILGQNFQHYSIDLDPVGGSGTLVIRFQGGDNNDPQLTNRTLFEIANFQIWTGYSDGNFQGAHGYPLSLGLDDGAGHQHVRRFAWDLVENVQEWTIPGKGSVIFTDDAAEFRRWFGSPEQVTIYSLKNIFGADFFWKPGQGRIKIGYATNANQSNYDDPGFHTLEEINFAVANGGVAWDPLKALSRQNPIGTGFFAPEDYVHTGLYIGEYGSGYWWFDLGTFKPPYLLYTALAGATTLTVSDPDYFDSSGTGYIGDPPSLDAFTYTGKDGSTLTGVSGVLAHEAGFELGKVWPTVNGIRQTGYRSSRIEIRRRPKVPIILAGAVLYSNLDSPSNPKSPTGGRWENNHDWKLLQRWDFRTGNPEIITIEIADRNIQFRHLCVVVDRMQQWNGVDQRVKANEVVAWEWTPGSAAAGSWASRSQSTVGDAMAYYLVNYGGVPATKVVIPEPTQPLGGLSVAGATVSSVLDSFSEGGLITTWVGPTGDVHIGPDPTSKRFGLTETEMVLTKEVVIGGSSVTWGKRRECAQVIANCRDAQTFKTYTARYPTTRGSIGKVVEIKDVLVHSAQEPMEVSERRFRKENARRSYPVTIGAARWVRPYARFVYNVSELDASGEHTGIVCYVESFSHHINLDDSGAVDWTTELQLVEMP